MLDRSVPYFRIILKRQPGAPLPSCEVPAGYRIVHYQAGDERAWAEIETSVTEFEKAADALAYFTRTYLPFEKELERRTLFIETEAGYKVGTFTAWWNYTGVRRYPFMHWVAVRPEYQGLGLGKAIIGEGVRLMAAIEGDVTMYIPTQTWSHKAIRLYRWAGFEFETGEPAPGGWENHTKEGIEVIRDLIGYQG
ncbi:MAG: GNAT family N-acetyltransferase [Anaerolineae bacterium]